MSSILPVVAAFSRTMYSACAHTSGRAEPVGPPLSSHTCSPSNPSDPASDNSVPR